MGMSYWLLTKPEIELEDWDTGGDLAANDEDLCFICDDTGLKQPGFFIHGSENDWFEPDEGIEYFRQLRKLVLEHPESEEIWPDPDAVLVAIDDLLERLAEVKKHGAKWALDFQ